MFIFFHFVVTVRLLQKSNDGVRKPISVKKRFSEQPSRTSVQSRKSVKSKAPSKIIKDESITKDAEEETFGEKTNETSNDKDIIKADTNIEETLPKDVDEIVNE